MTKKLSNKVHYSDNVYNNEKARYIAYELKEHRDWMDEECVDLCDTLNSIKGIKTVESCCGHNEGHYMIFFKCSDLDGLKFIQSCIDRNYWEYGHKWNIELNIDDGNSNQLTFLLISKSKNLKEIMKQVTSMIEIFNYYLNHTNRFEYLELDYDNFIYSETFNTKEK